MSNLGDPGNVQKKTSVRRNLREAVARQTYATRSTRAVSPAVSAGTSSQEGEHPTAGVHSAPTPTRRPEKIRSQRQKGLSGDKPARSGKASVWSEEEIEELKRLVPSNVMPSGMISWNDVEKAWINLNLPKRTKAGLSSKWRDIKINSATVSVNDSSSTQKKTKLHSKDATVLSDTTVDVTRNAGSSSSDVNPTVVKPDQCVPADLADDVVKTTFRKEYKKAQKIGCRMTMRKAPSRVSDKYIKPIICEVNRLIKSELDLIVGRASWNQLSNLVYAGAMTVSKIGNLKCLERQQRSREWFKNSYSECENLRRVIGKATSELNRRVRSAEVALTNKQLANIRMLKKKYKVESRSEITSLVETLKCRLQILQSRIALKEADAERMRVRHMPTKMLFRGTCTDSEPVDIHQIRRFWKDIVGVKKSFNSKSPRLVAWAHSMSNIQEETDLKGRLNRELWQKVVQKIKPWKAYGPDKLQGYWWKVFDSANATLYDLTLHHILSGESLPQKWITDGRIVLIHKSGSRSDPANFRPIACLNTCYKLVTGFIATYLDQYVRERKILPNEQIALRENVWACSHAHALDQTLIADATNQKQRPISVAWIDYAKAFDSVPHSYIQWLFKVMQVPDLLRKFLKGIMNNWRVRYEASDHRGKTERSNYLRIRSGVLQGDSFSPLLFCLAMAPISHAINSANGGYTTTSGTLKGLQISLSHLFYMDDLKLYANSPESLTDQIKVVASISKDINMKLNVKKCAVTHFTPKRMQSEQIGIDADTSTDRSVSFPMLDGEAVYKYLGMEQKLGLKESEAWDRAYDKCYQKAHRLWDSDLTFRQKVNSYNTTIIPVFKYIASCVIKGSGKYASVLERGENLDKKFRKLLVELKARQKSSCVARLYLPAEEGGYGLKSIKDAIEESTIYLWAYLCTKAELKGSLNLFLSMANRGKRSVVSDAGSILKTYDIDYRLEEVRSTVIIDGASFNDAKALARHVVGLMRTVNNTRRYKAWKELELAGRVLRSTASMDMVESFTWLKVGHLSSIAVRNVLNAQEGGLITRTHRSQEHLNDKSCRMCRGSLETIEHVLSCCSNWLSNLYIDRHDSAARSIHYSLCLKYGFTPTHYSRKVESVLENDSIKLYWSQPVQTKTIIHHNKPDLIVFNKPEKTALIIEVAISWFTGIERQVQIKTNRYCVNGNWEEITKLPYPRGDNLLRELQTTGWKVTFLPVVIGTCGEVLSNLKRDFMEKTGLSQVATDDCIERMQRSAALGSSRIIKNHLARR
jgi:Reverse transcriptase (RNA-dependent DNA polymerase)